MNFEVNDSLMCCSNGYKEWHCKNNTCKPGQNNKSKPTKQWLFLRSFPPTKISLSPIIDSMTEKKSPSKIFLTFENYLQGDYWDLLPDGLLSISLWQVVHPKTSYSTIVVTVRKTQLFPILVSWIKDEKVIYKNEEIIYKR